MGINLDRMAWLAGMLACAALTPSASAQIQIHVPREPPQAARVSVAALGGNLRLQTTALVPDRGSATLGGNSRLSEGRNAFGAPILGQTPYVIRGFGNAGYGREAVSGRVSASVRIIDLREEEFRQTGVRSR